MKRKLIVFLLSLLVIQFAIGQTGELLVQGTTPNLYIVHVVQPKETWYSIGRLYNISPKEIAPYNSTTMDKPLVIGQQVKVPFTPVNFSQDGTKSSDEVFVPVFHIIQEKEWLYRISVNYNKVPVESLEKWNNINKDQAKAGIKLIVGYLKVKPGQSALASRGKSSVAATTAVAVVNNPAVNKEEKKNVVVQDNKPAEKKPEEKKMEEKKAEPITDKPATIPNKPVVINEPTHQENKPVSNTTVEAKGGGYFKSSYEESGKTNNGNAGIFRSTSGWNDNKFYALMNSVPVGTIIKVSSPASGKTIYAKVLGSLPDMKESAGLTLRISDAGAAALETGGTRFGVEVKY